MDGIQKFETIKGKSIPFYLLVFVLTVLALIGILATYLLAKEGLYLTGMTTRVPWGLQIILAVFYVGLSAGSLVISSLYAIFGKIEYKPFARVTVFLSFLFLVAALLSIMSDWGRPLKIFEPFYHFNPVSMFSINPFLYITYMIICIFYLLALFTEKEKLVKIIAPVAVIWAIGVHSGTGAIFGFSPRELYCSPLLPPSFIAAALSSGTGFMVIMILILFGWTKRPLNNELVVRLGRLLAIFIMIVLYFIFVENTYRYYLTQSREAARYFLFCGSHSLIFWGGLIVLGSIIPAIILFSKKAKSIPWIVFSSALVVFGVLCERYIIVIPGQTHPPDLFPNMKIVSFLVEEGITTYSIGFYEVLQALGVVGIIGLIFVLGLRVLKFLPTDAKGD
ncbi:MAG: polysulfide reductase NrfD [bacterium]|nr:polysulfide reductase NrfD [bacterium]